LISLFCVLLVVVFVVKKVTSEMSVIKDKILYSKEPLVETLPDLGSHQNFGDYVLSFVDDPAIKDQVWLVNAGYDLTGNNNATCGTVSRTFGELETMSRSIGKQLDELGLEEGSIVQVSSLFVAVRSN
jgi:hypothetical protein